MPPAQPRSESGVSFWMFLFKRHADSVHMPFRLTNAVGFVIVRLVYPAMLKMIPDYRAVLLHLHALGLAPRIQSKSVRIEFLVGSLCCQPLLEFRVAQGRARAFRLFE